MKKSETFEYKLVVETSEEVLNERINDLLEGGWFLYKGPVMAFNAETGCRFAQALKKPVQYRGAWG